MKIIKNMPSIVLSFCFFINLTTFGMAEYTPLPTYLNIRINNPANRDYVVIHGAMRELLQRKGYVSRFFELKQVRTVYGTFAIADEINIADTNNTPLLQVLFGRPGEWDPITVNLYSSIPPMGFFPLSTLTVPQSNVAESVTIDLLGDDLKQSSVHFGW